MKLRLYAQSIIDTGNGVMVKATNGEPNGLPMFEWKISNDDVPFTNIGTAFEIDINRVIYPEKLKEEIKKLEKNNAR